MADWDGTMVPNRASDASRLRELTEGLCATGFDVIVITGTHVDNVDGQLRARPAGPGRLLLCVNRGSEVFECGPSGPTLLVRREATGQENAQLDRAAALTVDGLRDRGLEAAIVAQRLNRRKVDIIPVPEWADPPKARIADLVAAVEARLQATGIASLSEVVAIAEAASTEAGLPNARISSDGKYVEIGLTDKADAARWTFADLWEHGITAADVIIAGDEFGELGGVPGSDSLILVAQAEGALAITVGAEPFGAPPGVLALPGGPDRMMDVLEDQLRRRRRGEPPLPRPTADWRVAVEGLDDERERERASILTVADGCIGAIGVPILAQPGAPPETLAAGFYEAEGSAEHLRPLPGWNQLATPLAATARVSRELDLRSGVIAHSVEQEGHQLSAIGFSALQEPGTGVVWAAGDSALLEPSDGGGVDTVVTTSQSGGVAVHVHDEQRRDRDGAVLERIAVFARGDGQAARPRAETARALGVNALHRAHREAWARRWRDADILITGDDVLQRDMRFSLFHLMGAVATRGEAALGARGLSGDGYNGHVFWDSDVFVVPFLAATCPAAARAMLEYRVRRIGTAVEQARELGRRGAKFPWESASTGREITPAMVIGPRGEKVVVRNGEMEDHIVGDVAWAACRYDDWTGDESFRRGPLTRVLVETARYWTSRIVRDDDGSAHIRHVIGPDEYHEDVDDNAFTNVIARWNLRAAMARAGAQCDEREVRTWGALADQLVDGLNPDTLVYEQFAGFSQLTPFPLRETYGAAPLAADSVIGFDRVKTLQVVKQADALMLHLMVPDEVPQGSLAPNLDRYLPITAHGSSLSPAVHAALLARVSRHAEALDLLHYAAGLDVDGTSPTTAHGLHVATMGGVWLAMVEGFAGIHAEGDGLRISPRIPAIWQEVTIHLVFRGVRVQLDIRGEEVKVETDRPLRVTITRDQ
ncbi:MAG: glycoside hydrolase family 65 protein [Candidatus Dormibacteraeota bacterium]|nr:glycoside hydrolase family 65 protein [Candidatus Dormibacteraeota bacterium]